MNTLYADANATYPVDPAHYDAVAARLKRVDGNPSAIHGQGREAKVALEAARGALASLLGVRGADLVFTSGATEANNLAIQGALLRVITSHGGALPHAVCSAGEHASVREPLQLLAERGLCTLDVAPLRPAGDVDGEALCRLIRPETALVCIMHANNETGVVNDVRRLAQEVRAIAPGAHFHVDAVQGLGKLDLRWYGGAGFSSAAFSAHKIGAFKGIGALYLAPGTKLARLLAGGGQERGRRPGTENMPGIVSFGIRAAELTPETIAELHNRMARRRAELLAALATVPGLVVHGSAPEMLPNTVNFHVEGVPGEDLLLNLDLAGIQASSGSACSAGVARPSAVLAAMGLGEWVALHSVRVSLAADASPALVPAMLAVVAAVAARRR